VPTAEGGQGVRGRGQAEKAKPLTWAEFTKEWNVEGIKPSDPLYPSLKAEFDAQSQATPARPVVAPARSPTVPAKPAAAPPKVGNKPAADKLRKVAGVIAAKADEKQNADRLANTPRRARMAAGALEDARKNEALAKTMLRMADGIESGETKLLTNVSTKAAVEMLDDAVNSAIYRRQQSENKPYSAIEREKGRPAELADVAFAKLPVARADDSQWYKDEVKGKLDRFAKLGITTDKQLQAALTEYLDYREGAKKEDPIAKAERALVGVKAGIDY
jgi:hypothetical protein